MAIVEGENHKDTETQRNFKIFVSLCLCGSLFLVIITDRLLQLLEKLCSRTVKEW
jgi:hypothetical protein